MHYIRQNNFTAFFAALLLILPVGVIGSYLIGIVSRTLNEDQAMILWFLAIPALISASFACFMLIYYQLRRQYLSKKWLIVGSLLTFIESIPMQFLTVMALSPWWALLLGSGPETAAHWMIVSGCVWILTMLFYGAVFLAYRSLRRQVLQ